MPRIMPIKELRNTNEISKLAHAEQQPIFITKNGYSDLVVMSSELYDRMMQVSRVDAAIEIAERKTANGEPSIDLDEAFKALNDKYYG